MNSQDAVIARNKALSKMYIENIPLFQNIFNEISKCADKGYSNADFYFKDLDKLNISSDNIKDILVHLFNYKVDIFYFTDYKAILIKW